MSKSKMGSLFFDMLDKEQKDNFIKEYEEQNGESDSVSFNEYMSQKFPNFVTFLSQAFMFNRAKPSGEYWDNLIMNSPDGLTIEESVVGTIEFALDNIFSGDDESEEYISGREYYALMNREERTDFHSEFTNQRSETEFEDYLDNDHFASFHQFVQSAFVYSASKLGVEYWRDLADRYNFDVVYNLMDELKIKVKDGTN
jgi:hypothetical protein